MKLEHKDFIYGNKIVDYIVDYTDIDNIENIIESIEL